MFELRRGFARRARLATRATDLSDARWIPAPTDPLWRARLRTALTRIARRLDRVDALLLDTLADGHTECEIGAIVAARVGARPTDSALRNRRLRLRRALGLALEQAS